MSSSFLERISITTYDKLEQRLGLRQLNHLNPLYCRVDPSTQGLNAHMRRRIYGKRELHRELPFPVHNNLGLRHLPCGLALIEGSIRLDPPHGTQP